MLQALWSMARLRPSGVCLGTMDRQLDCTPQSPQPSHTASLMKIRLGRINEDAFLASAAFFGGAGLRVDQGGAALGVAQLELDRSELIAVRDADARRAWRCLCRDRFRAGPIPGRCV